MSSSWDASARRDDRPPLPTGSAPPSGAPGAPHPPQKSPRSTDSGSLPPSGAPGAPHPPQKSPRSTDAGPAHGQTAPPSGAPRARRPTVQQRPLISPEPWLDAEAFAGFLPAHPYVRRYWTALIGPGAVADLLRLTVAAVRGNTLRRPIHIDTLAREGLVASQGKTVLVRPTVPKLSEANRRRLPPSLRLELEQ